MSLFNCCESFKGFLDYSYEQVLGGDNSIITTNNLETAPDNLKVAFNKLKELPYQMSLVPKFVEIMRAQLARNDFAGIKEAIKIPYYLLKQDENVQPLLHEIIEACARINTIESLKAAETIFERYLRMPEYQRCGSKQQVQRTNIYFENAFNIALLLKAKDLPYVNGTHPHIESSFITKDFYVSRYQLENELSKIVKQLYEAKEIDVALLLARSMHHTNIRDNAISDIFYYCLRSNDNGLLNHALIMANNSQQDRDCYSAMIYQQTSDSYPEIAKKAYAQIKHPHWKNESKKNINHYNITVMNSAQGGADYDVDADGSY